MMFVKERLFNIKHCWQELGQQPKKHQKSDIYRLLWTHNPTELHLYPTVFGVENLKAVMCPNLSKSNRLP